MSPTPSGRAGRLRPVGIVAALAAEARQLGGAGRRGTAFAVLDDGTRVLVTGVGSDAAATGARELVAGGCRALASWGLAGGLDPSLAAGAVVLPEVVASAGGNLDTTADWRERIARAAAARSCSVAAGTLLTSQVPLTTVDEKSSAFRDTGAVAVDMESFAIGDVARASGLPFIAVRAVVDTAGDAVPAVLASSAGPAGAVSVMRILLRLAAQPTALGALLQLAVRYRAAARALRAVAATRALTVPRV